MKKLATYLLICIMHISASAEQDSLSKDALLTRSESLASEMGSMFQLAQNCREEMKNISANSAAIFFQKYFEEREVKKIMKQYKLFAEQEKGKLCDREKMNFYILMHKIAAYIRNARPLIKKP